MTQPLNTPWISLGILDCLYKGSSYQLIPQVMCCSVWHYFLVPGNLRLHWEVLKHAQRQSPLQCILFWCTCVPSLSIFGVPRGLAANGSQSVSLCFSLHRAGVMPGFPSHKVTAVQTHFLKSNPRAKEVLTSVSRSNLKHVQAGAQSRCLTVSSAQIWIWESYQKVSKQNRPSFWITEVEHLIIFHSPCRRIFPFAIFCLPPLKSLEVCSSLGSSLSRVGSASVLPVLSKSIPPTLVGKDRTSLRGMHDISCLAQMQWRWCLKRH